MHTDAGWQPVFKRQIIVQSEGSPHNTGKNRFTATLILHFPKWKISNFEFYICLFSYSSVGFLKIYTMYKYIEMFLVQYKYFKCNKCHSSFYCIMSYFN